MGAGRLSLFWRLPGRGGRGLVLAAFLAVLAQLLLPLGAMPMAGAGLPGDDICVTAPNSGGSPSAPTDSHDSPCCAAHCLSCGGGGLPSTVAPLLPGSAAKTPSPRVPASAELPESLASPFAARAPPSQA
jgi:hypothetical protein